MEAHEEKGEWDLWVLSEEDIDFYAEDLRISFTQEEKDEVARKFGKALHWATESWDEWLREAIDLVVEERSRRLKGGDQNGKHTRN